MRVALPMISYHSLEGGKSDRIYAVECHPEIEDGLVTFVTGGGGGEGDVRVWCVSRVSSTACKEESEAKMTPKYCGSLIKGHPGACVNCARFAPDGARLASAGDRGTVCVWTGNPQAQFWRNCQEEAIDRWMLPHSDDVYDVAWSPQGDALVCGAIDGTVSLWQVSQRKKIKVITDHSHYVQGVAFGLEFLATQSSDRTVRVYPYTRKGTTQRIHLGNGSVLQAWPDDETNAQDAAAYSFQEDDPISNDLFPATATDKMNIENKKQSKLRRLFASELQHKGFFRRLSFLAESSLLVAPAAVANDAATAENKFGAVVLDAKRPDMGPVAYLPAPDGPAAAVRACPTLFGEEMARCFAVCFSDSVCVYQVPTSPFAAHPLLLTRGLHRARLTDVAWARDASMLIIASSDGYLSFLHFEPDEFGKRQPLAPIPLPPLDKKAAKKNSESTQLLSPSDVIHTEPKVSEEMAISPNQTESQQPSGIPNDLPAAVPASTPDESKPKKTSYCTYLTHNYTTTILLFQ
mmetsp:Transcript_7456/g.11143  ORF Transcript_7456/g.11143 Transcript_7456/m.11143 type:complete len:519 (+) Transcript_7456:75-1631(+)